MNQRKTYEIPTSTFECDFATLKQFKKLADEAQCDIVFTAPVKIKFIRKDKSVDRIKPKKVN